MAQEHNPGSGKAIMDPASYEALLRIGTYLKEISESLQKLVDIAPAACNMEDKQANETEQ